MAAQFIRLFHTPDSREHFFNLDQITDVEVVNSAHLRIWLTSPDGNGNSRHIDVYDESDIKKVLSHIQQ